MASLARDHHMLFTRVRRLLSLSHCELSSNTVREIAEIWICSHTGITYPSSSFLHLLITTSFNYLQVALNFKHHLLWHSLFPLGMCINSLLHHSVSFSLMNIIHYYLTTKFGIELCILTYLTFLILLYQLKCWLN